MVDVRYPQPGFRNFQHYIGQMNYRGEEIYHFVYQCKDSLYRSLHTHMLQHISEYDMALVYYSKPLMQRYDELKKELQRLNDMPDKPLSNVIMYLHQNKGIFPHRRKKQFEEITE